MGEQTEPTGGGETVTGLARILAFVIVIELIACGGWWFTQPLEVRPPEPNLNGYPAFTAQQLHRLMDSTRPDVALDWDRLGNAFLASGFYSEANACYERASQLAPESAQHAYNWGFCLLTIGRLDAADEQFDRAISLGHPHPEACRYFLGANALRRAQIERARTAFEASSQVNASKLQLAELAIQDHDFERAQTLLDELTEEQPNAGRVHLLLGVVAQHQSDATKMTEHFGRADVLIEPVIGPWDDCAQKIEEVAMTIRVKEHVKRSEESLSTGRSPEVLYEEITRENEQLWDPRLENLLADIDAQQNRLDSALQRLNRVVKRNGADSNLMARLGFLQMMVEPAAAEETLRTGVRLGTGDGSEVRDMARALSGLLDQQGDSEQRDRYAAIAEFRDGSFLLDKLQLADAAAAFERSVELDASSQRAWFWLGRTCQLLGDDPAAIAAFDQCLELNPYHERAAKQRAVLQGNDSAG